MPDAQLIAHTEEQQSLPQSRLHGSWWRAWPLSMALVVYLLLSLWLAYTKTPWCDEGWFANPAYNLAFRGNLGSNVLEPSGFYLNAFLRGVQQRTYYVTPVHLVALAGWFRAFGASAFSARVYSICWGAITLPVLFYILRQLFPDRRVAALATLLTAMDFIFLWSTADARMEAPANALALCSLATYLHFREKDFLKAVLYSQVLGAAAVFTHPNAALVVLAMVLLAWRFDRKRVRTCDWRRLALAALPYLICGCLWGLYILQSPADFHAQFLANAAGHNSERFTKILHPDMAVLSEIDRHLGAYCIGGVWGQVMKNWMVLIPLLYIPAMIWFLLNSRRQEERQDIFATYTVAMILGITFLNGFKGYFYLIYVVPLYNTVFTLWLLRLWGRGAVVKCIAATVGLAFVGLQLAASVVHIRADEYHRDYEPAIRELAQDRIEGKSIVGTAALGFGLAFSGFKDDVRLGMYSGLSPDVVVVDRAYRMYAGFYATEEPAVFEHIEALLSKQYRLAAQHGSFWIFERVQPAADGNLVPWIDVAKIQKGEKELLAERLFRLIFSAGKMRDPEGSNL
jgi:4-amino-4-deoxy-L-arabinose transferase-like glycosyltransferase